MSKIGHMSVSYLNQYVEASINVLREHQKMSNLDAASWRLRSNNSPR